MRNFSNQRSEKNEKEVYVISAPTLQYNSHMLWCIKTCVLHPLSSPPSNNIQRIGPILISDKQNRQQGNLQQSPNEVVRNFSPLSEPLSEIYLKLLSTNPITRIRLKSSASRFPKNYDQSFRCAYHMDAPGLISIVVPSSIRCET